MKSLTAFVAVLALSASALACLPPDSLSYERREVSAVMDSSAFTDAITYVNGSPYNSSRLQMTLTHGFIWNSTTETSTKTVTANLKGNNKDCDFVFGVQYNPAAAGASCPYFTGIKSVERLSVSCK